MDYELALLVARARAARTRQAHVMFAIGDEGDVWRVVTNRAHLRMDSDNHSYYCVGVTGWAQWGWYPSVRQEMDAKLKEQ